MLKCVIIVFTLSFFVQNCLIHQVVGPTHGLLLTKNKFPGEFNPNNDVKREIRAEGCMQQVLYIAVWGDASAGSIAQGNGIKRIATIDHRTENVMGVYSAYCTIVTGEK